MTIYKFEWPEAMAPEYQRRIEAPMTVFLDKLGAPLWMPTNY